MIHKLMQMEERIVLDGSVAAAVASAANTTGADTAHTDADSVQHPAPTDNTDNLDANDTDSPDNTDPGQTPDTTDTNNTNDPSAAPDYQNDIPDILADALDSAGAELSGLKAVVINTDLADSSDLIAAVADDVIVITYSGSTDTLQDIIDQIDSVSDGHYFDSIALAAHSNAGGEIFLLDNTQISAQSLNSGNAEQVAFFDSLGSFLASDGRIDLLSCYSGAGTSGAELLTAISGITGREVAASTDATGNAAVGGDWILEQGDINAADLYFNPDLLSSFSATLQDPTQTLTGYIDGSYFNQFGAHIAEDNGILAVTNNNINDGIFIYTYQDSFWIFTRTLSLHDTSGLNCIDGIFDLDLYEDTLAISINGSNRDQIYIFRDVDNPGRIDLNHESEILGPNTTNNTFGEDIELEDGVLFATEKNSCPSSSSGISLYWENYDTTTNSYHYGSILGARCDYIPYYTNTNLHISADKQGSIYTLAATGSNDRYVEVWSWNNHNTSNKTTNEVKLKFDSSYYNGNSGTNLEKLTNVRVAGDYIIASAPEFAISGNPGLGAIAVFRGDDGHWTTSDSINGKASLAAILTGLPDMDISNIGARNIEISADGSMVFASADIPTATSSKQYGIMGWDLAGRLVSPAYTSLLTMDTFTYGSDSSAPIENILCASTGNIIISSSASDKGIPNVENTGVVDIFTHPTFNHDNDVNVGYTYIPGQPGDNPDVSGTDNGSLVFSFNKEIELSAFSKNLEITISHIEDSVNIPDITLSSNDIMDLLAADGKSITLDLNNGAFSDLVFGMAYTITVPSGMFADSLTSGVNGYTIAYTFTLAEGTQDNSQSHTDFNTSTGNSEQPDFGGATGSDSPQDTLNDNIGDLLNNILNDGNSNSSGSDFGSNGGDNSDEGEGNATGNNQNGNNTTNNNSSNNQIRTSPQNRGTSQNMLLADPFDRNLSGDTLSNFFSNSIDAFSSFGADNPELQSLVGNALGEAMTTNALATNSQSLIAAAGSLIAGLPADFLIDSSALAGSGHTAQSSNISNIIRTATEDLIQARGNALIANDLLRILSININGFADKIAENSFSGGVERLAESNEEFAYSYEVLNSLLAIVRERNLQGSNITTAELNDLLTGIQAAAREKSAVLSENGDRASKDVLSLLTRQMQQTGINKDRLQAQVSMVFSRWHDSLGLSEPVDISASVITDMAHLEQEAVPTL